MRREHLTNSEGLGLSSCHLGNPGQVKFLSLTGSWGSYAVMKILRKL